MSGYLRPDEMASESQIRKNQQTDKSIKSGFNTAAKVGATISGAGISSRILPFLSEYITPDLAIKGISKISPDLGNFLKIGMEKGLNVKDGLDFIKNNLGSNKERKAPVVELTPSGFPKREKKEPPKQSANIIEQESPELHQFMLNKIKEGLTPIQAAAIAANDKNFTQVINKLKNQHKINWSAIVETVFGKEGQAQPQNSLAEDAMNPPGSLPTTAISAESQAFTKQLQQQHGSGQQALMSILQKIQQQRGAR